MKVLTNSMVVIIFQYVSVSNHHVVHLTHTLYVNFVSIKLEKGATCLPS